MADVGSSCIDRNSYLSVNYTYINYNNSADATGEVEEVCTYNASGNDMENCHFGSFIDNGSHSFTGRDNTGNAGTLATGTGLNTYTDPEDFDKFSITSGDYIGSFMTGGFVDRNTSGGNGGYYKSGNQMEANPETFTLSAGYIISIEGQITPAAGGLSIPIAMSNYLRGMQR